MSLSDYTTPKESITYTTHLAVWYIENVIALKNRYIKIFSPEFSACDRSDFNFKLYLDSNSKGLYLNSNKIYKKYNVFISIKLLHDNTAFIEKNISLLKIYETNKIFINIYDIIHNRNLLPSDRLTILFNLRLAKDIIVDNSNLAENNNLRLLRDEIFADLTINIGRQQIKAHRCILAANNEYFNEILSDNRNFIEIEDIDEVTFDKLLKCIYSFNVMDPNDVEKSAQQLFVAADQLKMHQLKLICETALIETITFESAINMLLLADTNSSKKLMTAAKDFIAVHFNYVSLSDSWQNLKINKAKEVIEILLRKI